MASLNLVQIIGRCGKDAEMRYTANGTAQSQFSVAVSHGRGDKEVTEWFNVVLFGDRAEKLSQWITKGREIYVSGRLSTRSWEDDKGTKHYRTELVGNDLQLLGGDGRSRE